MTTMFIDTNGEMSFADNERLKFIMHYLKQGADDSLVEMNDGRFVREDSELSFTEIWLPAAEHQKRKIDEQQAKVEELQQENQRLANGNTSYYNQAIKQNEIIDGLQVKLKQAYEDIDTFAEAHERECGFKAQLAKDKAELQKRVDAAISNIEQFFDEQTQQPTQREYANFLADVLHDLKLEQALKGEG